MINRLIKKNADSKMSEILKFRVNKKKQISKEKDSVEDFYEVKIESKGNLSPMNKKKRKKFDEILQERKRTFSQEISKKDYFKLEENQKKNKTKTKKNGKTKIRKQLTRNSSMSKVGKKANTRKVDPQREDWSKLIHNEEILEYVFTKIRKSNIGSIVISVRLIIKQTNELSSISRN